MVQIFPQIKKLIKPLIALYLPAVLFLVGMVILCTQMEIPISFFTCDPASTVEIDPLTGMVSNIGILMWTAAAAVCLFCWALLRKVPDKARFSKFVLFSGIMTLILVLDDLFLLHEDIFPCHLGIPQKFVLLGYMGLILVGIVVFGRTILGTDYLLLLIALVFFGLSVFVDVFDHEIDALIGGWRYLFEDGFKFLGIVGWLGYYWRTCFTGIRDLLNKQEA
jgi:hypothetical protein